MTGRLGPTFSTCQSYYTGINSPITNQNLLFEFEEREYLGSQGFRVPVSRLYNITVGAARGGRGICNSEEGGNGFVRTVQVNLTTEQELRVVVGQRGTSPCDVIPQNDEIYVSLCQKAITDVEKCNETWYNFTREYDRNFYILFGGGAGGGASFVQARDKNAKMFDAFPYVIVGGGGGTPAVLDYDVVESIGVQISSNITGRNILSYQSFIDGVNADRPSYIQTLLPGTNGFVSTALFGSDVRAGTGAGYLQSPVRQSKDSRDGAPLSTSADGGLDCTPLFSRFGRDIPYSGVNGGFGGGGGACGGGGGGGGYTGGGVLDIGVTTPGEGGFSFARSNASVVSNGLFYNNGFDGFVDIVSANCGCVHECFVNATEDKFRCLCPNGTLLALDLNDCYSSEYSVASNT